MVTKDKIMMSSVLQILKNLGLQIFSLDNPSNYANLQSSGKHAGSPIKGSLEIATISV